MRLSRPSAVLLAGLVLLPAAPALAQGLNEVLVGRLSDSCRGLNGAGILGPPPTINKDYGPQLRGLCGNESQNSGTGVATSAGGTVSEDTRISSIGEEQRIRRRIQERRDGATGDSEGGRGLGLFFTADYEYFKKDTTRFETAFDRDTVGGTVGVDYILNRFVLLGLAFNYAHEFGNYDIGGGFDTNSYGVLFYTSLSPLPGAFVDLASGYIRKQYHFDRRVLLDIQGLGESDKHVDGKVRSDTHSDEFRFSAYGGYDFILRNITVGPRLGVNYRDIGMDGFRESGDTGVELAYENQNIVSLTMQAGVYASIVINTRIAVIVPQTTVEYVHEFLDDQRTVGFRFVQDLNQQKFLYQTDPPDRDYVNLAVGVSMIFPNGVTGFANFRDLLGYRDRSSYAGSLGVRFAF
jgi:outer membrane lipase/esterase